MTAKRRIPGTTSRRISSRLPARSVVWIDSPVTLPPGRARLATRPVPSGSAEMASTIGTSEVTCLAMIPPTVRITATLRRTNSAAISASRSARPSAQRYSIATFRPSAQPSSRSRCRKALVHWVQPACVPAPRNPMVGSRVAGCARAASGQATAAPSRVTNSRRLMTPPPAHASHPVYATPGRGGCISDRPCAGDLLPCGSIARLTQGTGKTISGRTSWREFRRTLRTMMAGHGLAAIVFPAFAAAAEHKLGPDPAAKCAAIKADAPVSIELRNHRRRRAVRRRRARADAVGAHYAGNAVVLPRARPHRAGRSEGAADPLPGQPAADWNGRTVQYGGGGFNGVLVTRPGAAAVRPAGQRFAAGARLCHLRHRFGA